MYLTVIFGGRKSSDFLSSSTEPPLAVDPPMLWHSKQASRPVNPSRAPPRVARDTGSARDSTDLDRFFQHYAGHNQFKLHLSVTYVAVLNGRVVGFATVAAGSLERASVARRSHNTPCFSP
jgi:hypothetical protein